MSDYVKIYFAENDTEVSSEGEFANAVEFTLRADLEQTDEVRLYAEAESGYKITEIDGSTPIELSLTGTTSDKWALAPDDEDGESNPISGTYEDWGADLTISEDIEEGAGGRVYFWIKAKAEDTESPVNDTSVLLQLEGLAEAV